MYRTTLSPAFVVLAAIAGIRAGAQTCASQDISPGTYYIRSSHPDSQPRYIERRSQDNSAIQFFFATGQTDEQFHFSVGSLGSGCYKIRSVSDGTDDPHYLEPEFGIGNLVVSSDLSETKAEYWRIRKNSNGTYSIINERNGEAPYLECLNRMHDDPKGEAQVSQCYGDDLYQFYLEPVNRKGAKAKSKTVSKK